MPANTVASRKAKGRKLQQETVAMILKAFPHLHPRDVTSRSMGASGEDIILSKLAVDSLPLAIECKATETINFRAAYEQAAANAGDLNPVVIHRKNRSKALALIDAEYLIALHATADGLARKLLELQNAK